MKTKTPIVLCPLVVTVLVTAGCASTLKTPPRVEVDLPPKFELDSGKCNDRLNTSECALSAYMKALEVCLVSARYFQSESDRSTRNSIGVGLFGALAGSVFSIGAAGNAAKAWSGLSGASNAYQTQLDSSSLGAASYRAAKDNADRNVRALQKKAEPLIKGAQWSEVVAASIGTGAACANGISSE